MAKKTRRWTRSRGSFAAALSFALNLWSPAEAVVEAREINSEANLCGEINSLQPGETLTLSPGDYHGPCRIRRGGTAIAPIVIQAQSIIEKPRILYDGRDSNVFEIMADFVTLRGLKIGPTKRNVAGFRILARAGITVEDCEFFQLGGIAIAATRTSVEGLYVRRNMISEANATAMYFGCHDGNACQISDLVVERNFINGVDALDPEIGYGIQFKLNTTGRISDNVIVDTKGPGIMVYGSTDARRASIIERNFVTGSRQSSGVLIGGGPARIDNNIASGNFHGGVTLQDYGDRGLLRAITVINNTSFMNDQGEFIVSPHLKLRQTVFALNAANANQSGKALPISRPGLDLRQNVDCTSRNCFVDPSSLNFSPVRNSPLSRARKVNVSGAPLDDYFGRNRNRHQVAGAVAFGASPIRLGLKLAH